MNASTLPGAPGLVTTIALVLFGLAVVALAAWRHGRPPDLTGRPRSFPWIVVLLSGAMWTLLMAVHLVNLLGLHTGRL